MRSAIALTLLLFAAPLIAQQPVATILGYHEVVPGGVPPFKTHPPPGMPDVPTEADRYALSVENFTAQLDYLADHGYHVVKLADVVDYVTGRSDSLPSKAVVITVDDGYHSAYQYIYPLMHERQLPFTLFVYPQIVSLGKNYVTWDQLREMAKNGVDVESHTYTHPLLTLARHSGMPPDEYATFLEHELADSKAEIEKQIGRPARFIAYPYSDVDPTVERAAAQFGYQAGVYDRATGELIGRKSDVMGLKRFPVEHATTLEEFKQFLLP